MRNNRSHRKYTLFLKEIKNAERIQDIHLIENIVKLVNPYKDFLDIAKVETLESVISNTTQAEIEFVDTEVITDQTSQFFPSKLSIFFTRDLPIAVRNIAPKIFRNFGKA